jgi:hypothetical protein
MINIETCNVELSVITSSDFVKLKQAIIENQVVYEDLKLLCFKSRPDITLVI